MRAALLIVAVLLAGCGDSMKASAVCASNITYDITYDVTFDTVGLLSEDDRDQCVKYKLIPGNVVWSVIMFETLAFPVYFVGFSLYEPDTVDCACLGRRFRGEAPLPATAPADAGSDDGLTIRITY